MSAINLNPEIGRESESGWPSFLYLEKGHIFSGRGFGASDESGGEAVFNTGMSGYQEIFTDPSYYKQIVVMTQPHLGNTGLNEQDIESRGLFLSGVVAREYCKRPSSWRSTKTLHDHLKAGGVPGISEVDTRQVTVCLRDEGAQRAVIFPKTETNNSDPAEYGKKLLEKVDSMEGLELVSQVSCKAPYEFTSGLSESAPSVVVYDFGVKTNILRALALQGFRVFVVPYHFPYQEAMKYKSAGIILSNGPGDPETVEGVVENIQGWIGKVPTLAICMGHQLLARALGCKTYKLKFGHHGVNHPVKDLSTGKILITSQNHGFSIRAEDLKSRDIELSHVSLNDQTVEGFCSNKLKLYSVQFHPEAKPGPSDAASIFDYFVRGYLK